jgi:hypothetical protein
MLGWRQRVRRMRCHRSVLAGTVPVLHVLREVVHRVMSVGVQGTRTEEERGRSSTHWVSPVTGLSHTSRRGPPYDM